MAGNQGQSLFLGHMQLTSKQRLLFNVHQSPQIRNKMQGCHCEAQQKRTRLRPQLPPRPKLPALPRFTVQQYMHAHERNFTQCDPYHDTIAPYTAIQASERFEYDTGIYIIWEISNSTLTYSVCVNLLRNCVLINTVEILINDAPTLQGSLNRSGKGHGVGEDMTHYQRSKFEKHALLMYTRMRVLQPQIYYLMRIHAQ